MELRHAVVLLSQAIEAFHQAQGDGDTLLMATVVVNLEQVLPSLLDPAERNAFASFADVVKNDIVAARRLVIDDAAPLVVNPAPTCLNNGSVTDCHRRPRGTLNTCNLCHRRGAL